MKFLLVHGLPSLELFGILCPDPSLLKSWSMFKLWPISWATVYKSYTRYRNLKSNLNKKVCCLSSPLQLQMHHYNISLYWPSLSLTRKPFQGRQLQQQKNQSLACTLLLHMSLPKAGIAHNYQDACKKYLSFLVTHHGIVVNFDFFLCYRLLGQNKRELTKAYYCCITTAC